jgi:predicted ATPase
VTAAYAERSRVHAERRDRERERSARIAHMRLAIFFLGAAVLGWALWRHVTVVHMAVVVLSFGIFGALVVWHARVDDRAAWWDSLRQANDWARARTERAWDDLPAAAPPSAIDLTHHPYAIDLDLFGRASLFQWLGPPATATGTTTLAAWLLAAAPPDEVRARQAAVAELAALDEWREALSAHGVLSAGLRQPGLDTFLTWAEGPPFPSLGLLQPTVWVLVGAIWVLLGLLVAGVIDGGFFLMPALAGIVLSFAVAKRMYRVFDTAGAGQQALGRYAALFAHVTTARFEAPRLRALQEGLSAGGLAAPTCMRRLSRILGFAELRTGAGIFHFLIQSTTLWDFHVLFALDRWRRDNGLRVRGWMEALGEVDALSSLATAVRDNPSWCLPKVGSAARFSAAGLGHPLLPDDRRVSNDVHVGPAGTVLLVTGSNMSGKSTLLRAIGLNAVLAQAGGPACAASLELPPCDLETSIRVSDSLELGLSYFMAALARLKGVVDAAEHARPGRVLLYLLDEILQGTNSAEREIAVLAVARHLIDSGAIGAMTTHDLNLAAREPLASAARLVHFTEVVDEQGRMRFDYTLREGIATSRNALRLMAMIGIEL